MRPQKVQYPTALSPSQLTRGRRRFAKVVLSTTSANPTVKQEHQMMPRYSILGEKQNPNGGGKQKRQAGKNS